MSRYAVLGLGAAAIAVAATCPALGAAPDVVWKSLQPGVDYAVFDLRDEGSRPATDARLHVVRLDPARAKLAAAMASTGDHRQRTAAEWCHDRGLAVAINLGMYRDDKLTNVGHAQVLGHTNNAAWSKSYKSALAFAPARKDLPEAVMVDLDSDGARERLSAYAAVVQNLRLIRAPGLGMRGKQGRRWSEAAVATDKHGHVLFIFSRHPYSMQELSAKLLALPLAITNAMHVEGGPEASLSIHAGGINVDLNGSYETGFNENDDEKAQWPIPNVLGVGRK